MRELVREQLKELNRLYKEGNEFYYVTATRLGLNPSALMILYGLSHVGRPCTQKELCDTWYLKKQTLHSALNQLIESKDVVVEATSENSRIKLIILTKKGKVLCERTVIPFLEAEERAFSRLTQKERQMLVELTKKHSQYIREEGNKLIEQLNRDIDKEKIK